MDGAGLSNAASQSAEVADALSVADVGGSGSAGQPSHFAVAALDGALASARSRQAGRVRGHADDMRTASARYDTTDDDAAGDLTRSV
nr:type VII secretion target [Mycobacterium sp. DBP42]